MGSTKPIIKPVTDLDENVFAEIPALSRATSANKIITAEIKIHIAGVFELLRLYFKGYNAVPIKNPA